ncbi:hypothetical protein QYE76_060468 [Lolium multiflorum]|uniref:F-box domain-containing protein n=1 Tax=Lolium multiflorum TaxID=4521 RepID=A0AAD8W4A2_LOLMU|nr:hypothetical protein QYE76_060468 [Lolium multiflorum]
MEANGGGGGLPNGVGHHAPANGALANGVGDHALPNGVGDHAPADHALANGALPNGAGQANHALVNGAGQANNALADGALANGGGHALANGAVLVANGGLHVMAAANAMLPTRVLYMAFLRLPAQEIARCRGICRLWRHITGSEEFRRDHQRHSSRTLMPLVFYQRARWRLCALDVLDDVLLPRPVLRFPLHHGELHIHGSCAGILLLSFGYKLYACNPCTRRWARLPPLHVNHRIIGFYATGVYDDEAGTGCYVLYDDGPEHDCVYWIFRVDAHAAARYIGRPVAGPGIGLDLVLANGIAPSYVIPPVHFLVYLCWLPQAAQGIRGILIFNTVAEAFRLIPPPTIQVDGERFPVGMGAQLFVLHEHLAMTFISLTGAVDVWVRDDDTSLWSRPYRIGLPVYAALNQGVFAVARDRSDMMQCPHILYTGEAGVYFSLKTIQESLLLHPDILPLQDTDAVDGHPPFFHYH